MIKIQSDRDSKSMDQLTFPIGSAFNAEMKPSKDLYPAVLSR